MYKLFTDKPELFECDIKIIDIIDENKKTWYSRYTYHLKNYKPIYRCKFSKIQKNLISQLSH